MTEKAIIINKQVNFKQKKYKFAYCLKQGHLQSIKKYVCLEEQCSKIKSICEYCFKKDNQHNAHQIIPQELLLNIAQQKLISSKIPQQLEMIDYKIEKLQANQKSTLLVDALKELKELLHKVMKFDLIQEYSVFQTNSILELAYKMIAFNKNFVMIKEPLSLNIMEFEIQVESISSIFDMIAVKTKRLNEVEDAQSQLLKFQNPQSIKKKNQTDPYEVTHYSQYDTPRKSYTQVRHSESIISVESNNKSDNQTQVIRTRSMDMALDLKLTKQKKKTKDTQILNSPQSISYAQKEKGDREKQQIESEQSEDIPSLSCNHKKSSLQELINDYNNFEVVVDPSKMLVQRAHEGIIYNFLDLGEGSGNSLSQVVTLGEDGLMKFWNPVDLKCLHTINFKINDLHFSQIRDIQYLKRIKCIAVVCKNYIGIINIKNYKVIKKIYVESNNLDSCDQLGQLFLVNPSQQCIMIYDMFTFDQIGQLQGIQEDITSLAYAQKGGKYYYFTGTKNGNLSKFDLSKREHLFTKKVNRITIFYLSTVRYQGGDECIVTYSCNEYVNASYVKFVDVETLDIIVNLNFTAIDSAICYNNEIYLMQSNQNIVQILVEYNKYTIKRMTKIPSSFSRGSDVFNEGLRWVKSQRIALLSQFSRTQHYSNLVAFPII
ncbi:hypothetical protein TTHERM_00326900 (macronuclear) [Tetrahymena thermophila SB210]|uniref:Uncharacterized protein n=1 Tax=Tetrahymena thermophila (strain SB210) TaxID=312017 RepID=I7MAV2_TETTS|nr:hypothetical protein TTHERM_00326900 [Tetrahymena thermophila SB210]EAS06208.1 hypothetical protein TTHERM_00326900 [Tetrahymena thermophila SB210]|eukprot:XP_001026453.1 hypothetical protein TTHERM_00326900 [Tetrahymena thermophila SB210]